MTKSVWGPITWKFLHTIVEKLIPEKFNEQRNNMIEIIKRVCETLPCPDCKLHAVQTIRSARLDLITNKEDLINFMYEFHNLVNKRTRKQHYTKDVLTIYKDVETAKVVNEFAYIYSNVSTNNKLMSENFHRKRFLVWLREYLINNGKCFNG